MIFKKTILLLLPILLTTSCKEKIISSSNTKEIFNIPKPYIDGEYKIGLFSNDVLFKEKGLFLAKAIEFYTQDIENPSRVGKGYYFLPKNLHLKTSPNVFWIDIAKNEDYQQSILELQQKLYLISIENEKANIANQKLISLPLNGKTELFGNLGNPSSFVKYLFYSFNNKNVSPTKLANSFIESLIRTKESLNPYFNWKMVLGSHDTTITGATKAATSEIKFATMSNNNNIITLTKKLYSELSTKTMTKNNLINKGLELKKANLDTLFILGKDGVVNNKDLYKSFIDKNEFPRTKIFILGENVKHLSSDKMKTFAGGNISTASFNKYAAAFTSGFQTAVSQIDWDNEENNFVKTKVAFFIGSTTSSTQKKKAIAFKKGIEYAAKHAKYSSYLDVSFVTKESDDISSNKKIHYSIFNWKEKNKIAYFTSSDEFLDSDNQVIYLAGSTIKDWTGSTMGGDNNIFEKGEDFGLIGSMYKYNDKGEKTKNYGSRKIKLVLDQSETKNINQIGVSWTINNQNDKDSLQRHQIKVLGFIGGEAEGNYAYTIKALNALYFGGDNYMLGKHTIYGSQLDFRTLRSQNQFNSFSEGRFFDSVLDSIDLELNENNLVNN